MLHIAAGSIRTLADRGPDQFNGAVFGTVTTRPAIDRVRLIDPNFALGKTSDFS